MNFIKRLEISFLEAFIPGGMNYNDSMSTFEIVECNLLKNLKESGNA